MPRVVAEAGLASAVLPPAELPGGSRARVMDVSGLLTPILASMLEARTGQQLAAPALADRHGAGVDHPRACFATRRSNW